MSNIERYYLRGFWHDSEDDWFPVTRDVFETAERYAGFYKRHEEPGTATGGFSGNGIEGRVRTGPIVIESST